MINNYKNKIFISILNNKGTCVEMILGKNISFNDIYNKFKNRFSKEAIKSAWLNNSGSNNKGETLLIIGIDD